MNRKRRDGGRPQNTFIIRKNFYHRAHEAAGANAVASHNHFLGFIFFIYERKIERIRKSRPKIKNITNLYGFLFDAAAADAKKMGWFSRATPFFRKVFIR